MAVDKAGSVVSYQEILQLAAEAVTSKCVACRKKVCKPEYGSLSNASQRKKNCCTWNFKDARKIDPRSKEVARMQLKTQQNGRSAGRL